MLIVNNKFAILFSFSSLFMSCLFYNLGLLISGDSLASYGTEYYVSKRMA